MSSSAITPANNAPPPSSLQLLSAIQQYGTSFVAASNAVMVTLEGFMLALASAAVVFLIITGVLIFYSHLNKRLGQQFMIGGMVMAVFMAFGVPYLVHAYC